MGSQRGVTLRRAANHPCGDDQHLLLRECVVRRQVAKTFTAPHGGMALDSTCSLMETAQGRTCSYVVRGIEDPL